jgi:hypothetical protein
VEGIRAELEGAVDCNTIRPDGDGDLTGAEVAAVAGVVIAGVRARRRARSSLDSLQGSSGAALGFSGAALRFSGVAFGFRTDFWTGRAEREEESEAKVT